MHQGGACGRTHAACCFNAACQCGMQALGSLPTGLWRWCLLASLPEDITAGTNVAPSLRPKQHHGPDIPMCKVLQQGHPHAISCITAAGRCWASRGGGALTFVIRTIIRWSIWTECVEPAILIMTTLQGAHIASGSIPHVYGHMALASATQARHQQARRETQPQQKGAWRLMLKRKSQYPLAREHDNLQSTASCGASQQALGV